MTKTTKHKGFTITITQANPDRHEYKITRDDGSTIGEDAEGFAVSYEETLETAKEVIDYFLEH